MCYSRYSHRAVHFAACGSAADHPRSGVADREPFGAADRDMRASDPEREATAEALRAHAGDGRLEPEELEERLARAFAARTRGELAAITADLPRRRPAPPPPPAVAPALLAFAALMTVLVAVWALTGGGGFWPAWALFALIPLKHRLRPRALHPRTPLGIHPMR